MSTAYLNFRDVEEEGDDLNDVVVAKATSMAVLFVASMLCGLLPLLLSKKFKMMKVEDAANLKSTNRLVVSLLAFGGGVLLSTTFMHLIPEVDHNIVYLQAAGLMPTFEFSLAFLLTCIGFFIMFFVEECVHLYIHRREKRMLQSQPLVRNLSIRHSQRGDNKHMQSTAELIAPDTLQTKDLEKDAATMNGHGHSHNHAHSHMPVMSGPDGDDVTNALRGLLIVLALSIHELFEGLAVGLESSASNVWYMLGAISAHKLVIAFCIGMELLASRTKTYLSIIYITTFAVVSPLGIGVGLLLVGGQGATGAGVYSVVLQGLASGTLMYVIFFEIWKSDRTGVLQFFAALIGFCIMFGLQLLTPHSHSHGHTHAAGVDDADQGHSHDRR